MNIEIDLIDDRVESYVFSKQYEMDIPIIKIIDHYAEEDLDGSKRWAGQLKAKDKMINVIYDVEKSTYQCHIDGVDSCSAEDLISTIEGPGCEITRIIKDLTGIDEEDYIDEIDLSNGVVLLKGEDGFWNVLTSEEYDLIKNS